MSLFLLVAVCLLPSGIQAATKVFLRNSASALGGRIATDYVGYGCDSFAGEHGLRLANTTQGSSTVSTSQTPTSTAPPCQAGNEGTTLYYRWVTPPVSSGFTLSGNVNYSLGCRESATQLNAGIGVVLYRWSVKRGGIVSTIHTSGDSTECPTTAGLRTIAAAVPTTTSMEAGDRIVIVVEIRNVGGSWGGNNTRTFEVHYDGAAASAGDSFVNFVDTFSFSSDTNNGRKFVQ